jgi:hypothetical protein
MILQLFSRNIRRSLRRLKNRLSVLMKEEKLRGDEFRNKSREWEGVHFCEPEKGSLLDEEDEEEEGPVESLVNYLEIPYQHKWMMPREVDE